MEFARIYPPRPLEPAAVEALLVRLASDPTHVLVAFEARSQADGDTSEVSYWLGSPPEHLRWLRRTMHDLLPGLIIDTKPAGRTSVTTAARVKVRPPALALAVDRPEQVTAAILSALNQQLQPGEHLVMQLLFGPRRTPQHRRGPLPDPGQPWWTLLNHGQSEASAPVRRQHDQRALQAGLATCVRFGVTADDSERRGRLLTGLLGGTSTAKAPGTFIRMVREAARHLNDAVAPWRWEFAPAAAELVGLLAWPLGERDLPGLPPLHPKLLPAPPALSKLREPERVFGVSTLPGDPRPIGIAAADSLLHGVFVGPTGSGKSTVLLHLIRADIHAGRAVLVIDPKRQLIDDIVERAVPEERISDVVIIDPAEQQVPGFNPLDVGDRDPDVVVDGLLAVFAAVFHDGWGPRTQDIIHSGLLTLARVGAQRRRPSGDKPFTLLDLPRLLVEAPFRRSVIGHVVGDPGLGQFWAWYEAQSPQALATVLAAPLNKLRQYLLRPSVRRILGQAAPTFRLRDVFRERKVVLAPLNEALIGPITAQLLGGLLVAETWAATLERATEPHPMKHPGTVWVDEAQNFLNMPTSLDAALNASRSMGVSWNLAFQFRAQLPPAMAAAADSNARNKIVFKTSDPKDAAAFARQAPELEDIDFMTLPQYNAYATVVVGGASQPWCSLRTLPPPEPTGLGPRIRQASTTIYGAPPTDEAAQAAEASSGGELPSPVDAPVGRKRRTTRETNLE
jgi:energy-coupling factor transporter ATP-binding protein EcfA2